MASRNFAHIEAAKKEARRLGATITITPGGKHLLGIIEYKGKRRKAVFSNSNKSNVVKPAVKDVRAIIRRMDAE